MPYTHLAKVAAKTLLFTLIASCSNSTYTIGGTVSGLSGSGLQLQNNGGDNLAITADGEFSFDTRLKRDASYAVTVSTQPSSPSQTCIVSNDSGTWILPISPIST